MQNKVALEEIVSRLPGIRGVKILGAEDGEVKEIHILAESKKPAKQLVRDVETAIYAASGVRIDRKTVSVAQLSAEPESPKKEVENFFEDDTENDNLETTERFSFKTLSTKTTRKNMNITVCIDDDGKELTGSTVVNVSSSNKHMAVAEATVAAIRQSIPSFRIHEVSLQSYGNAKVILCICSTTDNGNDVLQASARILGDDLVRDAVIVILETLNKM